MVRTWNGRATPRRYAVACFLALGSLGLSSHVQSDSVAAEDGAGAGCELLPHLADDVPEVEGGGVSLLQTVALTRDRGMASRKASAATAGHLNAAAAGAAVASTHASSEAAAAAAAAAGAGGANFSGAANLSSSSDASGVGILADVRAQLSKELSSATTAEPGQLPEKSKLLLVLLEVVGLGICGVDRCYMGQIWLGVVKGCTFGGLVIWCLIDYAIVVVNSLAFKHEITTLGLNASFSPSWQVDAAFWVVLVVLLGKCLFGERRLRPRTAAELQRTRGGLTREALLEGLQGLEQSPDKKGCVQEAEVRAYLRDRFPESALQGILRRVGKGEDGSMKCTEIADAIWVDTADANA
eukprot:TRINITY_DN2755_c1_g4_i2.p1 TRINITY_DN2755_c1_g4~~TRINITY_DN2755_c1_g4_i2.p1  ORF type:complete len:354 (-),score=93.73 TRINITY_DN2755_c1_g4_i2:47-1108(-)